MLVHETLGPAPYVVQGLSNFLDTVSLFDEGLRGQVPEGAMGSVSVVMASPSLDAISGIAHRDEPGRVYLQQGG